MLLTNQRRTRRGRRSTPSLYSLSLLLFGLFVSFVETGRSLAAVGPAGGEYVDHTGARHRWEINTSHSLIWEGKAYLPAGVVLHLPARADDKRPSSETSQDPRGNADGAAAAGPGTREAGRVPVERAHAVSSALDLLAAHGVKDLLVVREGGWSSGDAGGASSAGADQALVEALEARGMRYGIALEARPERPLAGYLVAPTRIELPAQWMQPGRRLSWNVDLPGARAALYLLVDVENDSVIAAGSVPVSEGQARIDVALRPARRMFAPGPARLLVLPEQDLGGPRQERPVDFWSAWEDTQQALARRVAAVKWGPGLRFFARPVAAPFGLRGEAEALVPASGAFRLQFASWLEHRYSVADLNAQWALNDRQASSLAVAARLVPLWSHDEQGQKTGWLLDPVTNEWYRADLRRSRFWPDLQQFRADSIRRALSRMATLLKKVAADVPVVWEWTEYHPLYTNPEQVGGLDGLSFAAQGRGRDAAVGSAAYAYAQAEESARPTWFLAIGQRFEGAPPPASAEELRLDWNWLREIGAKGFFADGVMTGGDQKSTDAAPSVPAAWTLTPESLDWVRDYGEKIGASEATAAYRPAALYFPSGAVGTGLTGRMENGVWWLPSLAKGVWLTLGEETQGYWIERAPDPAPAGAAHGITVLWSSAGPQKATFVTPDNAPVRVYDAAGRPLKPSLKQGRLQLTLDAAPVLVTGLPLQNLFPVESASQALREFEALVKMAEAQKMEVAAFRLVLNQAKTVFAPATAATAYQMVRGPLAMLRAALTPYVWLEGEAAAGHNWSGVQADPRASAGAFLRLDRASAPASGVYQARWSFTIAREATYEVWLAGSVPGSAEASSFTWRIDDRPPALAAADEARHRYASGLGWTRLGQVQLTPGPHAVMIAATGPSHSGGYHLAVDALVLSREPFQPDGVRQPQFRVAREPATGGHGTH